MLKSNWLNHFLFSMGFVFVILGIGNSVYENVSGGVVCIATGFFFILITKFNLESFEIFGLKAKLKNTIDEAEKIIAHLRGISIPISEISVSLTARSGRIGVPVSREKQIELIEEITKELKGIEVANREIERVKADWYFYTAFDFALVLYTKLHEMFNENKNNLRATLSNLDQSNQNENTKNEMHRALELAVQDGVNLKKVLEGLRFEKMGVDMQSFVDTCQSLSDIEKSQFWEDIKEEWEDLNYLITHKEIRRLEHWKKSKE